MKIRIISDGFFVGTRVENAETGEPLEGVAGFTIHADRQTGLVGATITLLQVELGVLVETETQRQTGKS